MCSKSLVLHAQIRDGGGEERGGLGESLGTDAKCQHANMLRMTTLMRNCLLFIFVFSSFVIVIYLVITDVH